MGSSVSIQLSFLTIQAFFVMETKKKIFNGQHLCIKISNINHMRPNVLPNWHGGSIVLQMQEQESFFNSAGFRVKNYMNGWVC